LPKCSALHAHINLITGGRGGAFPCLCPANNSLSILIWVSPPTNPPECPACQHHGMRPPCATATAGLPPADLLSAETHHLWRHERVRGAPGNPWEATGKTLPRQPPCPRHAGECNTEAKPAEVQKTPRPPEPRLGPTEAPAHPSVPARLPATPAARLGSSTAPLTRSPLSLPRVAGGRGSAARFCPQGRQDPGHGANGCSKHPASPVEGQEETPRAAASLASAPVARGGWGAWALCLCTRACACLARPAAVWRRTPSLMLRKGPFSL